MGHRDVDLVISDEQQMNYFLKFMIYSLYTIDGRRNSAKRIIDALNKQSEI